MLERRMKIERLEKEAQEREAKLREQEQILAKKEKELRGWEANREIAIQAQEQIKRFSRSLQEKNSELEREKSQLMERLQSLSDLEQYRGLAFGREYIEESIEVRRAYFREVSKEIMERLKNEGVQFRNKKSLREEFASELSVLGFKKNW